MISASKALNTLERDGFITSWEWWESDASFNEDGSLIEKIIKVTHCEERLIVDNEVYGSKAVLYFICENADRARQIAAVLREAGGNPSFKWCSDNPDRFEMQVSYFKGRRWWE